jgi:DNA polymerase III subunit beta
MTNIELTETTEAIEAMPSPEGAQTEPAQPVPGGPVFRLNAKGLLGSLDLLKPAINPRSGVPALACVLIKPETDRVSLIGTDLENFIRLIIPADCQPAGAIAIPYARLLKILKATKAQSVTFEPLTDFWVRLRLGELSVRIQGWDPDSIPPIPAVQPDAWRGRIAIAEFNRMAERTRFAASPDQARYNLCGVYLERKQDGGLRMAATDGHRLSYADSTATLELPKSLLIPVTAIDALVKLAAKHCEGADMMIALQGDSLRFVLPDSRLLVARLVVGEFPDYRGVMPKPETVKQIARVSAKSFAAALKAVSICSNERWHGVRLTLENHVKPACLTVSACSPDLGEASQSIPTQFSNPDHPDIAAGFNADYLTEYLAIVGKADVAVGLIDDVSGALFQAEADWSYIVMPIRSDDETGL